MNQLTKMFDGQQLRIIEMDNEAWFVANDVCKILDIKNTTQAVAKLDNDERSIFNIGRQGKTNVVNEYGLYNLVLGSRKPEAKQFKRWITHEVIPSIRKHGAYMTPEKIEETLLNPDTIIKLATNLKEEQQKRAQAEQTIELQKPKVQFAKAVETSDTSVLVGELAKILKQNDINIGQNRLFKWLRNNGYLIKKKGESYNLPTQASMDRGLFEIKKRVISNPDGSVRTTRTAKVTGKGQIYFVNKFLSEERAKNGKVNRIVV
ncbi:phage antirepressor [Virgibacillus salexigens]|uniref:Putative phage-encoded protein n=1 Tax=Virgibacillus massiliensis TaxID=1462526 RepID=A0A024QAK6_9BACI|nr:phage antirepressor [Virgibacillus massiliensis]CDQ39499.1 putative phage-encoded protein [Virgibacillus massiliensis]